MLRRGGVGGRPELLSFPSEDHEFARAVHESMAGTHTDAPEELQRALRPAFPRVVVRRRGLADEAGTTWYVFRDGKVIPT